MPHALRAIRHDDETLAALGMLNGFDDDLATESTRVVNRLHGLLTQIHPALERAVAAHLEHPAVTGLLQKYPTPPAVRGGQCGANKAPILDSVPGTDNSDRGERRG